MSKSAGSRARLQCNALLSRTSGSALSCAAFSLPLPLARPEHSTNAARFAITANWPRRRPAYAKLAASSNPYLRAEGLWGIEHYQEANDQFRDLIKQHPKNAEYRVRWGHLFLERFNNDEAHGLFEEALKIDRTTRKPTWAWRR